VADELRLIPDIPSELREAAQIGLLVPFIGAGVSRLGGCPDWRAFADGALQCFVESGKFNHAQLAQLDGLSPRVKLTLALSLEEESGQSIDFRKILHPIHRIEHEMGRRVYASLSRISRTFVTTNYDEWLDEDFGVPQASIDEPGSAATATPAVQRRAFYRPQDFAAANLNERDAVFHLHGSVKERKSMVLTTPEYLTRYASDRSPSDPENFTLTFLEVLFRSKTLLFIGYRLAELEILEYVVLKARQIASRHERPRHFLLEGYFSHERELMLVMKRYYRDCGIELIPYLKDQKGWDQLVDVLESFARQLPPAELAVLAELKEMEELLNG
jgi:NAD-dependent SIR2 family protein deacetylase